MTGQPLRIVLVEDSVLLREGLVRLFDEAGYITAGAFGDADDIVARVRSAAADVAILDVRLPPSFRDEGIKAALLLRAQLPELGILVLSQYVEGVYARELLAAGDGGVGYLLKDRVTSLEEFTDAVRRVHERGTVLDPLVVQGLLAGRPNPLAALTPRERDVLELMAEGRSNASIASRLFIGVGAVEKNVSAIFAKLGLEESATEHRRVLAVHRVSAAELTRRSPGLATGASSCVLSAGEVREQEPAVLVERLADRDRDVLAREVDLVEAVDRGLHVDEHGVHVGDHAADHVLPLREAGRHLRRSRLRRDRRQARVDRQAERDDPLGGEVGAVLRVRRRSCRAARGSR